MMATDRVDLWMDYHSVLLPEHRQYVRVFGMPLEERPPKPESLGGVVDSDGLQLEMVSDENHLFDVLMTGQRNETVRFGAHS